MKARINNLIFILGLVLTACAQATIPLTPTLKSTGVLTPYLTITPSSVPPTATQMVFIPITPAPTPTPFLHTLTDSDTMLGLAFKYGITLEDLQAANPGVDPHYLSVGKQLVIPLRGVTPQVIPTPTPAPVALGKPACYPTGEGGAWCIVIVLNELNADVENISAWIGLFNPAGENFKSTVAYAPLNILRQGEALPIMSYFSAPLPEKFDVQINLLSALAISPDDQRYLDEQVEVESITISPDGQQATAKGQVKISSGTASKVWVLAVAYDTSGAPIGMRKLESDGELNFEITVYSLAGPINHVDLYAEARP